MAAKPGLPMLPTPTVAHSTANTQHATTQNTDMAAHSTQHTAYTAHSTAAQQQQRNGKNNPLYLRVHNSEPLS